MQNGPLWESPHGPRAPACAIACQFASSPARWPVIRQRHGPITREPGGVARSLRCGTVSNATEGPKARGANAEGARTDAPKVPRGVGPATLVIIKRSLQNSQECKAHAGTVFLWLTLTFADKQTDKRRWKLKTLPPATAFAVLNGGLCLS